MKIPIISNTRYVNENSTTTEEVKKKHRGIANLSLTRHPHPSWSDFRPNPAIIRRKAIAFPALVASSCRRGIRFASGLECYARWARLLTPSLSFFCFVGFSGWVLCDGLILTVPKDDVFSCFELVYFSKREAIRFVFDALRCELRLMVVLCLSRIWIWLPNLWELSNMLLKMMVVMIDCVCGHVKASCCFWTMGLKATFNQD